MEKVDKIKELKKIAKIGNDTVKIEELIKFMKKEPENLLNLILINVMEIVEGNALSAESFEAQEFDD